MWVTWVSAGLDQCVARAGKRQEGGTLKPEPRIDRGKSRRRQGAITKTGNSHVRLVLVESAWSHRFPTRKTAHLQRKAASAPPRVQALAWAARKRLCVRNRHLYHAGKPKCHVTTAVARELAGFIRAIACEVSGRTHGCRAVG